MSGLFLLTVMCFMSTALSGQPTQSARYQDLLKRAAGAGNTNEGIKLAFEALSQAATPLEKQTALYEIGRLHIESGDYLHAIRYLETAMSFALHNKDFRNQAIIQLELGRCRQHKGDFVIALSELIDGLKNLENINDQEGIIRGHIYLAEYYRNLAKYDDAIANISIALNMAKNHTPDKALQIKLYNRAAAIHSEVGHYDSSLQYTYIALNISKEMNDLSQQATSYNEIAFVYENTGRLPNALKFYEQAEQIWRKANANRHYINAIENQARVYAKMKNYRKSNELLLRILDVVESNKWYISLQGICSNLHLNYTNLGNRDKAHYYQIKSLEAQMQVFKDDNAKELEEIKTRYQSEKNELLLKKQKREIEIANESIERKRKEALRLWIGFALVLGLCILISLLLIQRSRTNKQLAQRNKEIENSNLQLKQNLAQIESLIQEVHHRVKNNLQFIYSILELEIDANKSIADIKPLRGMQRRIMAMSLVHELLYSKDNSEQVLAKTYIQDLIDYLIIVQNTEKLEVRFDTRIDEVYFGISQCISLGMIISELVANAFKYAFNGVADPLICIELKKMEKEVILVVEDNGRGVLEGQIEGTGLGLRLIRIFSSQLNGNFNIERENRFKFTLNFPIA